MSKEYQSQIADITVDEPYVQLEINPPTGYMGIKVKQATMQEALKIFDELVHRYADALKLVPGASIKGKEAEGPDFGEEVEF